MNKEYDQITAKHYAAYRPNLHASILRKCIDQNKKFSCGLDVGCGTGQSSLALAAYCDKVIGIEPSRDMLSHAIRHPTIDYEKFDGVQLKFEDDFFDIITFAGSWYYAKSQKLLNEIARVGRPNCIILLYDFEILLGKVLSSLGIDSRESPSDYNHQEDFTGLLVTEVVFLKKAKEEISLEISSSDLSHLLLSSKGNYGLLRQKFGDSLYNEVATKLAQMSDGKKHNISGRLYYTLYNCTK